ncbi:MAG: energy transducer TonB [Massilia sp.]|nr:energy transducer TonB [Massilia sp.]
MSSIKRHLRIILQSMAGFALLCAAATQPAQAQDSDGAGNDRPKIDFASCAKPVYPHADVLAGHQGTVTVGFLVDENGGVKDSKVTGSSGFMGLDVAAQTALAKCSFRPALENGIPVQKWVYVKYVWTLG